MIAYFVLFFVWMGAVVILLDLVFSEDSAISLILYLLAFLLFHWTTLWINKNEPRAIRRSWTVLASATVVLAILIAVKVAALE